MNSLRYSTLIGLSIIPPLQRYVILNEKTKKFRYFRTIRLIIFTNANRMFTHCKPYVYTLQKGTFYSPKGCFLSGRLPPLVMPMVTFQKDLNMS